MVSLAMIDTKILIRFFDRGFLLRTLLLLLLYSLVPIGEIALLFYLSTLIGVFLTLALLASTGLFGLLISYGAMKRTLKPLRRKIREGYYPEVEFVELAGLLASSLLLVTPGFVTDLAGLVLYSTAVRRRVGRAIVKRLEDRLKELYEYIRLEELE